MLNCRNAEVYRCMVRESLETLL